MSTHIERANEMVEEAKNTLELDLRRAIGKQTGGKLEWEDAEQ